MVTSNRPRPMTVSLLITTASAAVSMGYAIRAAVTGREVTAQYAAARSAALTLAVGAVLARPAWRTGQVVVGLGLTMGAVQVLDAVIGLGQGNLVKTLGPAATGVAGISSALAAARAGRQARAGGILSTPTATSVAQVDQRAGRLSRNGNGG